MTIGRMSVSATPARIGLAVGFGVGVIWWCWLVGGSGDMVIYAPMAAVPWAAAAGLVGEVSVHRRGCAVPVGTAVGAATLSTFAVARGGSLIDMPVTIFIGGLIGLLIGHWLSSPKVGK